MNGLWSQNDRPLYHSRLKIIRTLVIIFVAVLCVQLIRIQIVQRRELVAKGLRQQLSKQSIPATRGAITTRDGKEMTENLGDYVSIGVNPDDIIDRRRFAREMSQITKRPPDYYITRLQMQSPFVYLERKIAPSVAKKIKALGWAPLQYVQQTRRIYPHDSRAGQVLGYLDVDQKPKGGVESSFDSVLAGQSGWRIDRVDATPQRRRTLDESLPSQAVEDGAVIVTTLDYTIQACLEDELASAVTKYNAESATGIVLDPRTGEILAMASVPLFDPNTYSKCPPGSEKNRVIANSFEPGSVFKLIGASYLLENRMADLNVRVNTAPGCVTFYGHTIYDHGKNFGTISFKQALSLSSNVGVIKLTSPIASENIYRMIRAYGFGMTTGIDLPGEESGSVKPVKNWSGLTKPSIVIGQEVGVTLLQLAMAYGAVANGGMLMKPMIVAEKRFPDGSVEIAEPREVRRVISPRTAQLLTECFTEVVESGTGTSARIAGMPIAGKTGTAEIRDPATGKYSKTDFNASFVGYFPSISPRYLIVANICKPKGIHYGGDVAAPVFKNVAERIIGRNPGLWRLVKGSEASREEELVNIPEMTDGRLSIAMAKLSRASLRYRTIGRGDYVYDQDPPANTPGHPRDIVTLVVGPARGGKNTVVPLMTDQSLRDALEKGTKCGLKVQLHGSGRVLRQEPQAGTLVPTGKATNVYGEES